MFDDDDLPLHECPICKKMSRGCTECGLCDDCMSGVKDAFRELKISQINEVGDDVMSEWIPVAESDPPCRDDVLVACWEYGVVFGKPDKQRRYTVAWMRGDGSWITDAETLTALEVTHWMPLPEPPEDVD